MKSVIFLLSFSLLVGLSARAQWSLTGNSGTSPGTNFLGTTDGQALIIKTDGAERINISSTGNTTIKTPLGTGSEQIFTIKGGTTAVGVEVNLFEINSSGSWRFGGASSATALSYNSTAALLSSGSGTDVDFTPSGQLLVNSVSATRLRGKSWYQTHIEVDRPTIEYRTFGGTYVGAGESAHKFTVYTPLTDNGAFLASFDNGSSPYMIITKDGNVGINTTTPAGRLTITGTGGLNSGLAVQSTSASNYSTIDIHTSTGLLGQLFGTGTSYSNNIVTGNGVYLANYATNGNISLLSGGGGGYIAFATDGINASNERMRITAAGNVGIGTTAPAAKFHVKDGGSLFAAEEGNIGIVNTANTQNIGTIGRNTGDASLQVQAHYANLNLAAGNSAGHINLVTYNSNKNITLMPTAGVGVGTTSPNANAKLDVNGNIFTNGKIAIGTTDMTKIGSYSLVVNGEALFTKARVKLYTNWPDYVFEEKYNLLPIAQLDQYIKINKHLPGIPAAAEVAKDGIDLGSNQALLLQKIEELTLYIIEQNKKIETLQKDNAEVREKLNLPVSNK